MKLVIKRLERNPEIGLIGHLYVLNEDGNLKYICDTCENLVIGKERGQDLAIPEGRYKLGVHQSSKFSNSTCGNKMALIYSDEVPKDRYILIHAGNSHKDTAGCILLGNYEKNNDMFTDSRDITNSFYAQLASDPSWTEGSVTLEIENYL